MWFTVVVSIHITLSQCAEVIVSMHKPAYQIDEQYSADRAVDNHPGSCSLTRTSSGQKWWLVDLKLVSSVKKVKVQRRSKQDGGKYQSRAQLAKVYLMTHLFPDKVLRNITIWTSVSPYSGSGEPHWSDYKVCAYQEAPLPAVTEIKCEAVSDFISCSLPLSTQ